MTVDCMVVETKKPREIVDITWDLNQFLKEKGIKEGSCHLFLLHTTAAVTTADLDPGTDLDMMDAFDNILPKLKYRHPHDPSHVTSHIMSSLIGPSLLLPINNGQLKLGTWQRVVLVELDGPRKREIEVTLLK